MNFLDRFLKNAHMSNFMKMFLVVPRLFHVAKYEADSCFLQFWECTSRSWVFKRWGSFVAVPFQLTLLTKPECSNHQNKRYWYWYLFASVMLNTITFDKSRLLWIYITGSLECVSLVIKKNSCT